MPEPVRIAFVITELEFGGAERCLTNLAIGIDRTRFAPMVCSLAPRPAEGKDSLVRQLEAASVPVHFLNLRSSMSFFSGLAKLKRLLRQHETEVVQTFLFHANVIGALAAKSAGVSRIVSGVRVADPARWRMVLERFALRRTDHIVCVSQSVAEQVASKGGFPRSKLRVIPNGIDLTSTPIGTAVDRTQLGIAPERRILLCVGRLHRQKGFDWLLRLAPELLSRLPKHDLVIAGDGPERKSLRELATRLGIQNRVHFVGWRPDVPQWMQEAEILLLPSRWEGMPNVLIEAMGRGLPVVASSVEGVKEVLGPLAEEQAVPVGDTSAFVAAVCRVANDSHHRQILGNENRERIQAEFSLNEMIPRYEELYD
ncbi:MAG: glycosyltransferase [Planctomycetota bacterium]|nr:glycosyltransferase [Planctomycetota bacterium]